MGEPIGIAYVIICHGIQSHKRLAGCQCAIPVIGQYVSIGIVGNPLLIIVYGYWGKRIVLAVKAAVGIQGY